MKRILERKRKVLKMDDYLKFSKFDLECDITNFEFTQDRLLFEDYLPNNQVKFGKVTTEYKVRFEKSETFSERKVPLIIPIKDMPELLKYTLNNLIDFGADKFVNIIVLDDRSESDILSVCDAHEQVSYIRCDYSSGFSYAMIANIAAMICHKLGFQEIIYWNSDMYLPNSTVLPTLIQKHRENEPAISGTKLVYPKLNWEGKDINTTKNMSYLKPMHPHIEDFSGRLQYAGTSITVDQLLRVHFHHAHRGELPDNIYVNVDRGVDVVTGAYSMIDLDWLVHIGGFNPSLAKIYNDVEICLRAREDKREVHYYGKSTHLYHEESTNLNNDEQPKMDHQYNSDNLLFQKLWNLQRFYNATLR